MKLVMITLGLFALFGAAFSQGCGEFLFQCPNGNCIPMSYVCDGDNDCGDWADEPEDITLCPTCEQMGRFECDNGNCIPRSYACDGGDDCGDGSDEPEDPTQCPACLEGQYRCANGRCINGAYVCDGDNDCGDMSDEPSNPDDCPACSEDQFRCASGKCIGNSRVCDGRNDCNDWADETEEACPCAEDEHRCAVPEPPEGEHKPPGACIPPEWVCDADGIADCPDGSDEANCTVRATHSVSHQRVLPGKSINSKVTMLKLIKTVKTKGSKGQIRKPIRW